MASGSKVNADVIAPECKIQLEAFTTSMNLRVIPLGSYDLVLGMDWLEQHNAVIDCKGKTIRCLDDSGSARVIFGIKRPFSLRKISAKQLARCARKGCNLFAIAVNDLEEIVDKESFLNHPVLQKFSDVFVEDIPGIPPRREIDFRIDLVPGTEPISKTPYRMTAQELVELKLQLEELLEKGLVHPSVSPWGAPIIFVKKKDGTLRLCIDYR